LWSGVDQAEPVDFALHRELVRPQVERRQRLVAKLRHPAGRLAQRQAIA
jgi:hypothetical protein